MLPLPSDDGAFVAFSTQATNLVPNDNDGSADVMIYDRAAESLLAQRPDVVGFTTLGCSFLFVLNVAARLKQREPELPVLLGGPHATMLHREILERFSQFDVIVRYEADEIFPDVLANLESRNFAAIPGLSWRVNGSELKFNHGGYSNTSTDDETYGSHGSPETYWSHPA